MSVIGPFFTHQLRRESSLLLCLVILLLICAPTPLQAAPFSQVPRFTHLQIEDGLSQATVNCVVQDPRGFIWFGTQEGLNRYDGHKCRVFTADPADPASLSSSYIYSLFVDQAGRLWVGTGEGLDLFDRATETFSHYTPPDARDAEAQAARVVTITEDNHGDLWLGCQGHGLYRFNPGTRQFTLSHEHDPTNPDGLASGIVQAVLSDSAGRLWIGSAGGLQKFDPQSGRFSTPESLDPSVVLTLCEDGQGGLWIGSDAGLDYLVPATGLVRHFHHDPANSWSLPEGAVNSLILDQDGRLWAGTSDAGVVWLDPDTGKFHRLQHDRNNPESLADDRTLSLYEDQAGVIWVGTYSRGVDRYDRFSALFTPLHSVPALAGNSNDYVRALLLDHDQNLWLGTDGLGAARQDRRTGLTTHYAANPDQPGALGNNQIFSLCEDSQRTIWLGAAGGELYEYLPGQDAFRNYTLPLPAANSLKPNSVRVIHEAGDGTLLLGTDGSGAFIFNPRTGRATRVSAEGDHPAHLANSRVFSIMTDHLGNTWFGVFGSGLLKIDGTTGKQTHYHYSADVDNGLSSSQVMPLIEDSHGIVWIGTNGGGLDRLDPATGRFTHYRAEAGLPNNAIYAILEDNQGMLWLSHNKGLTRFDPRRVECRNFDKSDGLQSNEFNGCASYRSRDGELFFGGIDGYNRFRPEDIRTNHFQPPVVITDLQLASHSVRIGPRDDGTTVLSMAIPEATSITLHRNDGAVSFEYAALQYGAADKTTYAYRLVGLEDTWNEVGNRRFATYSHLGPGQYTFEVKAANPEGGWDNRGSQIQVTVLPAYWESAWFRGLVIFLALSLAWALYRYRTRLMRFRAEALEKSVRERTLALECEMAEREAVQKELAAAHKEAVKATEAKSTFLATMSHEIRTPMNGVMGMTQLLLDSPTLSPEDRDQTETIQSSGEALLTIINDILDFSKVEAGKMELEAVNFDLQTAAAEVAELLAPKAAGKGLELIYRQAPGTPRHLVGDVGRIRQIILNLVGNAIKFTAEGEVVIDIAPEAEGLKVSIRDTGIGLTDEERQRLFQPFSQADSSTTRRFGGTGLGLAICRQLTELMGGVIGCDSAPGEGSTFWFTLNLPAGVVPQSTPKAHRLANTRVLAVCANQTCRTVLAEQITSWSASAVTVASEEEAAAQLTASAKDQQPFDLILVSSRPRQLDGKTLLGTLGNHPTGPQIPILLLAPTCLPLDEAKLAAAGFAGALTKPVRPEILREAANTVLAAGPATDGIFVTRRALARLRDNQQPLATNSSASQPSDTPTWRVLVAEDNTVNQRVAKRMLEKAGCTVDLAANGEEAVEMWRKFPYDVVFMDCRMPEVDGYTATGEIRAREGDERHTPIVAMTANVMEGDRERCLAAGMDDYLPKPLRMDDCHRTLRRWAAPQPELVEA